MVELYYAEDDTSIAGVVKEYLEDKNFKVPVVLLVLSILGDAAQDSFGAALILLLYLFVGGAVIGGIMKALFQRLDEIDGGEEEEASRY